MSHNPNEYVEHNVQSQFDAFIKDMILPLVDGRTRFTPIYETYVKYCEAIDQMPLLNSHAFAKRFSAHIVKRRSTGINYYACVIREGVLVEEEQPTYILNK